MFGLLSLLSPIVKSVFKVIDDAVEDKDKRNELKAEIQMAFLNIKASELKEAASIVRSEIRSDSWLARSWRPLLMMVIILIVFNNFVLAPYVFALFGFAIPTLALPDALWNLMTIGVGGYVVGRSGEKIVTKWRNPDVN